MPSIPALSASSGCVWLRSKNPRNHTKKDDHSEPPASIHRFSHDLPFPNNDIRISTHCKGCKLLHLKFWNSAGTSWVWMFKSAHLSTLPAFLVSWSIGNRPSACKFVVLRASFEVEMEAPHVSQTNGRLGRLRSTCYRGSGCTESAPAYCAGPGSNKGATAGVESPRTITDNDRE